MLALKRTKPAKVAVLVSILLIALGGMGYVVLTNFVRVNRGPVPVEWAAELTSASRAQFPPVPVLTTDHPVFGRPQFTERRLPVNLPVEVGPVGRENPFVPPSRPSATTTAAPWPSQIP